MLSEEYSFSKYCPARRAESEMLGRSADYNDLMQKRRSVRKFSPDPVDPEIIRNAIRAAGSAPSGANKQPWTFCLVSNPEIKSKIRKLAEEEEYVSYKKRMNQEWLDDLRPLGTDHIKPYLEIAPYLIVVFKQVYEIEEGERRQNYYVNESVGIAVGMLLSALHYAGLSTLTHTPSPMNFLSDILERPKNEKPYLLIPVGYAHDENRVPDICRKALNDVLYEYE